jgi:2-beta-glucuronyltransferase
VLARAYAAQLPASVRERAAAADIIVIESCAAVALFPRLKSIAPRAKFVYCASDRLESVGMHPVLTKILQRTAKDYDLVRVPAASMLADFGDDVRAMHIPHGIDRSAFANAGGNPYKPGTRNAVVAGDMMFDHDVMAVLIERFPDVNFHAFGRMEWKASAGAANLHHHGEVPFGTLVPYLVHADVGIAPYTFRPDLAYLSESSLKLIQYSYCRLPVVAPFFAKGSRSNIFDYVPEDAETAVAAFRQALVFDKGPLEPGSIKDWDEVVSEVIRCATIQGARPTTTRDLQPLDHQ